MRGNIRNKLPSVAVIITYHNEGNDLLHRALASVNSQTYRGPVEVIVVDDASIIKPKLPAESTYPVTIVRSEKNIKSPAARNLGAEQTYAKCFAFLDADDIFLEDRIKSQVDFLEEHKEVSCVGGGGFIQRFGKTWLHIPPIVKETSPQIQWSKDHILPLSAKRKICFTYAFHSCGLTVRRSYFEEVGGFDSSLRWGEEWDLQIRLAQIGPVGYVSVPGYKYIQREGSVTQKQDPRKQISHARIMDKALHLKNHFTRVERSRIKAIRRNAMLLAGQLYFESNHDAKKACFFAAKAFFGFPSLWGLRSTIRYSLALAGQCFKQRG